MKLLPDWKDVLRRAWSVKFMLGAAALSGGEVAMQILQPGMAKSLPPGVFAALSGVVTSLALVARLMAQNEAEKGAGTEGSDGHRQG